MRRKASTSFRRYPQSRLNLSPNPAFCLFERLAGSPDFGSRTISLSASTVILASASSASSSAMRAAASSPSMRIAPPRRHCSAPGGRRPRLHDLAGRDPQPARHVARPHAPAEQRDGLAPRRLGVALVPGAVGAPAHPPLGNVELAALRLAPPPPQGHPARVAGDPAERRRREGRSRASRRGSSPCPASSTSLTSPCRGPSICRTPDRAHDVLDDDYLCRYCRAGGGWQR